jgi:hypothetical protein
MDAPGVTRAVKAFYNNDPYYPRPLSLESRDQQLWTLFEKEYLSYSANVIRRRIEEGELESTAETLPEMFIDGVIIEQSLRLERVAKIVDLDEPVPID